MPRSMNKKPTQHTKQNHMPIKKEGGRRPSSKVQDIPPTTNSSMITRHAPTDEPETNKEHKAKPYACYTKRGRWLPFKVQDMPPTNNLPKNTRHAPSDKQETNTEHKATPHA